LEGDLRKNGASSKFQLRYLVTLLVACAALPLLIFGCSSIMTYEKEDHLTKNEEFDQQVKIVDAEHPAVPKPADGGDVKKTEPGKFTAAKKTKKKHRKKKAENLVQPAIIPLAPQHHEPELEGDAGFIGRRPEKDPFQVGEKLRYNVTYLGMTAGSLTMELKPFAEVNGRKSYQYEISAQSKSIFSSIYALDDTVVNLIDFASLVPSVFTMHIKESSQLKEARAYFDRSKGIASYWEKKVTKSDGEKEKKLQWEIPDYSQNVFSAIFYMRVFQWDVGVENAFRVADDGQNLIFKAKGIRKEKIKTDAGEFEAIVVKPEIHLRGVAKPMGDIFVWLSNDEHKYVLRMEGKIKIGTLTVELAELHP
jgi:hypothetical protein